MALDFPSSPTNGQVYGNYYYNSARGAWNALLPAATPNFFTNAQLIDSTATSSGISTTPFTVIGSSGQTANLQEWKNSAGTTVASITSAGNITALDYITTNQTGTRSKIRLWGGAGTYAIGMITPITFGAINNDYAMTFQMNNSDNRGFWWGDDVHTSAQGAMSLSTNGKLSVAHSLRLGYGESDTTLPGASTTADINIDAASKVGIVVKAAASQTADLQQWQSSTGAVLSEINSAGELQVPRIGLGGQPPNSAFFIDATGRAKLRSIGAQSPGIWFTDSSGTESAFLGMGGTSSNDALGIWHNSAWRLQVDTLGRVAMPFQPAFYASGSGTVAVSGTQHDELIPFTIADLNRGNYFNTSTSRFTAPITGVYYFWMQAATTTATSTGPEIYILKNGSPLNTVAISYDSAFYNTFGGSYIISLNANDYVQMSVRNNNGTSFTVEKGRSRFAGYLIG